MEKENQPVEYLEEKKEKVRPYGKKIVMILGTAALATILGVGGLKKNLDEYLELEKNRPKIVKEYVSEKEDLRKMKLLKVQYSKLEDALDYLGENEIYMKDSTLELSERYNIILQNLKERETFDQYSESARIKSINDLKRKYNETNEFLDDYKSLIGDFNLSKKNLEKKLSKKENTIDSLKNIPGVNEHLEKERSSASKGLLWSFLAMAGIFSFASIPDQLVKRKRKLDTLKAKYNIGKQ